MKKILLFFSAMLILTAAGCQLMAPVTANIYTESNDSANNTDYEQTSFTAEAQNEYRIAGTFNTTDDTDEFAVPLSSGLSGIEFRVAHNGSEVLPDFILGFNYFPLSVTFRDSNGNNTGSVYLLAASKDSNVVVPSDAVDMLVVIVATPPIPIVNSPDFTSGDYFVQFTVN